MSDWFSLPCPNGCAGPMIHTEQEGECEINCPTCDLIERTPTEDCEVC